MDFIGLVLEDVNRIEVTQNIFQLVDIRQDRTIKLLVGKLNERDHSAKVGVIARIQWESK
jgi:predicted RNA-binding protein